MMPLVICYVAIEHGPVEIVDLPIEHGDYMLNNRMVIGWFIIPINYRYPLINPRYWTYVHQLS